MMRILVRTVALSLLVSSYGAESATLQKQLVDGNRAEDLSTPELAGLGDPFFMVVLKDHADAVAISDIDRFLLVPGVTRKVFVVDENIRNPAVGQSRRAVVAYSGTHPTAGELAPNVTLSLFFDSNGFADAPRAIEAWGWDNQRGRYNYYKMDDSGTPNGVKSWKFRGSSDDADLLTPRERVGTCMQCHINGAPIMKELPFPWNNWHSVTAPVTYLRPGAENSWPVSRSPQLANLEGAEVLETQFIVPSITQFNSRRINKALERRDDDGNVRVEANGLARIVDGQRLLRSLFETTEVNFASSDEKSGLHPFDNDPASGPSRPVKAPNSLFLNADLIAGNGISGIVGLSIGEAKEFKDISRIESSTYARMIASARSQLGGQAGDTDFAWFIPEPSHFDNSTVELLLKRGVVSHGFVAAVMAIDLETPVFSSRRAALFKFIPNSFQFKPRSAADAPNAHPDQLTREVIERIRQSNPAAGTPEREFMDLLSGADPVAELRTRVIAYRDRMSRDAQSNQDAFAVALLARANKLRAGFRSDPVLRNLDETGDRLLPITQ